MFKIKKFVVVQTHANKKIAGMARLITDNNLRGKKKHLIKTATIKRHNHKDMS